jgi:Fe-S-cluster-containing dehydrogenase component
MKKILIDLEKCYNCDTKCTVKCSYHTNFGKDIFTRMVALGIQEHVCRRCDEPPCVNSCPQKALEKDAKGMLQRYSMRCTSCKTCTVACPFGVIIPEIVEYKTVGCDYCEGRCNDSTPPLCVKECHNHAFQWVEVNEDSAKDIYAVRDGKFFVHTVRWRGPGK